MESLKNFYEHYELNTSFLELISVTLPQEYGKDTCLKLYEVCGIAPFNLDPFEYRKHFFKEGITANHLSTDTNANISNNSVVQYQDEVHKGLNKLITYNTLYNKLLDYYSKEDADLCLKLLLNGTIFLNDTISFDLPYCYGFDLTCLLEGLQIENNQPLKMKPVKYSRTFLSQFIQLLAVSSAHLLGACAFPNFFVILDWFYRKEYGEDYVKEDTLHKSITQDFQHVIYSVNWNFRRSQCVDEYTEVLTPQGFKKYDELNVGDDIYTWHEGALKISKVNAVSITEVEENLHSYSSRDLEFSVTQDHRILHKPHGTPKKGINKWELSHSYQIFDFKQPTPIPIAFESYDKEDYPISDDELKFLVCILTEGNIDKRDGKQPQLRLYKSPKRAEKYDIEELLIKMGISFTKRQKTSNFSGMSSKSHLVDYFTVPVEESNKFLKLLNFTKKDIPDWFFELSRRQALLVIKTWSNLDGYHRLKGENSFYLQCDNSIIRDKLQHLAVLAGVGSKTKDIFVNNNEHATHYLICYNRTVKSMSKKEVIAYKGIVWCPTTDDGIVMYRKNGSVFISGNTAFTNLSVMDMGFLKQIFGDYKYPDLSDVNFESVKRLSQRFYEYFERIYGKDGVPTFPVMTLAVSLTPDKHTIDPDFYDWVCKVNHKKSIANCLLTEPNCFSSCCFGGSQKVLTTNQKMGINLRTIKEVIEDCGGDKNTNFKVYHNGNFVKAKKVKVPLNNKKMYEITTSKNTKLLVTEDHLHLTPRGDVRTDKLTTEDWLATSVLPFNQTASTRYTSKLTYEQGVLIGAFVGDGYTYYKEKTNSYEVNFAISEKKLHLISKFEKALEDWGITKNINTSNGDHNVIFVRIYSEELYHIVKSYVSGDKAINKSLILREVLKETIPFREGIKDGWLATDGSNGNRIYSSSTELIETGQVLLTSLGYISHLWTDDRDEDIIFRGKAYQRNAKVQCIKFQKISSKRSEKNVYKIINNTIYIKIKDIKEVEYDDNFVYCFDMDNEEEPYFTLPNGIITHNCRLKNDLNFGQEGFQNSFGVSGVSVGSHRVCGINMARLPFIYSSISFDEMMECIHKILLTHRRYLKELIDKGLLPLYSHNLMYLSKQYSTIGFVGVPEFNLYNEKVKAELNDKKIFDKIQECTKSWQELDKEFKAIYNIEEIPAEMMASRLPIMDTALGYNTDNIELYSNQYTPLTTDISIDERLRIQAQYEKYTSGGSVLHVTMFDNEPLSERIYKRILDRAIELGVTYLGINYAYSVCEHGHTMIGVDYDECPVCTAPIEKVYTRVVGFITAVEAWSIPRQHEFPQRKSINVSTLSDEAEV